IYVIVFTLISFILANQGLNSVISMSVPVLSIVYPVAITSILLILIARFVPTKPIAQQIPVAVVTIISILSVFHTQGWMKLAFSDSLPLKDYSLEWFPIAVSTTIIGYIVATMVKNQKPIVYEKD